MKLKKVEFLTSAADVSSLPKLNHPAVAFAGRSNVGKSSLINTILNRKNFARTSNSPGKTRLINYFTVNDKLHFVDLPGYGFAGVSRKMQDNWRKLIENFLTKSDSLQLVLVLVDTRRGIVKMDEELIEWLENMNLNFVIILTKSDKLSNHRAKLTKDTIMGQYRLTSEPILFSTVQKRGTSEIWAVILTACFPGSQ